MVGAPGCGPMVTGSLSGDIRCYYVIGHPQGSPWACSMVGFGETGRCLSLTLGIGRGSAGVNSPSWIWGGQTGGSFVALQVQASTDVRQ